MLISSADSDEISFAEGEEITNIEMPDPGWWIGICRGKRGIFPKAYVQLSDALEDLGKCGTAIYDYEAGMLYLNAMRCQHMNCDSSFSLSLVHHANENTIISYSASLIHRRHAQTPNTMRVFMSICDTHVSNFVMLDLFFANQENVLPRG